MAAPCLQGDKTLVHFLSPRYCLPPSCPYLPETNLTTKASQLPKPHSYLYIHHSRTKELLFQQDVSLGEQNIPVLTGQVLESRHPSSLTNACMFASSTSTSNPRLFVHCLLVMFLSYVFVHLRRPSSRLICTDLYESAICPETCRTLYAVTSYPSQTCMTMSIHTAFFCVGLMFDEHGACQTVAEQWNDHAGIVAWLKNTAILKRKVNGQRSWEDKRRWTHRILIAIRSTTRSPTSLRFVDKTLTRRPVSVDTRNLLCEHIPRDRINHLGSPLVYGRHDCDTCQLAVLHAEIQEPADVPPIPFSWQTAIWKQYRLSASIIDCSDFRFAILNSNLEHQIQHLYDYRALPYLILQIYIEELLSNTGRAKNSDYRIDPPPTVIEKFNHHINLKRQCLAYIPFLCWLIDFDILVDTVFACEPCLRSCLLHDAPVLQATLIYADQELNHLNQHLHFQICYHHPHPYPPPPKPPTPKPSTPKPSTPKPPTPHLPQPHNTCCTHCPHPTHPTYPPHLLPMILIFLLLLLILPPTLLLINSISKPAH